MTQHLRMYCPKREDQNVPAPRGGRKVLRPPPPAAPSGTAVTAAAAAEAVDVPMPYLHVRWQAKPVPHMPRNATSLPGPQGVGTAVAKPRAKRESMAPPPPPPEAGCWGGCSVCNQCGNCRKRTCNNNNCSRCKRCPKCRKWGELLAAGDSNATRLQNEAAERPEVEKRQVLDPGNQAKLAATAHRPKSAPPGARQCPFCKKWLPSYHQENCPSMPYATWIEASRVRQIMKFGQETVDAWQVQCQHCTLPFPSGASKRVHLSGCERRRNEAGLPLNQFPATR